MVINDLEERSGYDNFVNWITQTPFFLLLLNKKFFADISKDNYHYYRGDDYDTEQRNIIERYKYWNGHEGNSPTPEMSSQLNAEGYPTQATICLTWKISIKTTT